VQKREGERERETEKERKRKEEGWVESPPMNLLNIECVCKRADKRDISNM